MKSFPSVYENSRVFPIFFKQQQQKQTKKQTQLYPVFTSNWVASYLLQKNCLHSLSPVSHLPFTPQLAAVWLLAPGILLKQLFTKINSNFLIFKSNGYFSVLIVPNHFLVFDIVNHSFPLGALDFLASGTFILLIFIVAGNSVSGSL